MIKDTFVAIIYDTLQVIQKNKNFFELNEKAKKEIIQSADFFPEEISEHLISMTEKDLKKDIDEVLFIANDNQEVTTLKSGLAKAFANFCINQIPQQLEQNEKKRPSYKGRFGRNLETFYASGIERQIIEQIQDFIALVHQSSFIVVQTPIQIDLEQKTSIRNELIEKYPHSIPNFSVNKKLIGGLRIFVDGKTRDHSWISQINKLTSITNK